MKIVSEEQAKQLLKPGPVIAAIEAAFARDYRATVRMPPRMHLDLPSGSILLVMPCHDSALPGLGIKLVSVQEPKGQPNGRVQASYLLLDPESGKLRALLAANHLTDIRTAATSAVATKYLARSEVHSLGIFGTGRQAQAHLTVLREVRSFRRFLVCGSHPARSEEFASRMTRLHGLGVEPVDARRCVFESDVICTCTNSRVPLFDGEWLRSGTHLNLVGAFRPDTREVDDATVRRARLVVDTYEGALAEAGDLLIPLQRGVITREHVLAELHEVVSAAKGVRQSDEDITVFKSVGCALEDLVTAKLLFDQLGGSELAVRS